ncbi:MAG: endonuclease/exonuclease/phosphatase family protein [Planctomycetota bacterium]|nr:endonuclease/exonuclease/phosphatase family protein [Planctomycetota bacterium]
MRKFVLSLVLSMLGISPLAHAQTAEAPPALPRIGEPQPKPRTPAAIRLATYNVENLFDTRDDPALSGDLEDLDDAKPAEQRRAVAQAIRRIDADVIALQEIESFDALIEFRDNELKGLGYDHVVSIDAGDARGIENAVISRFPLKDPKVWLNMPLQGEHPEMLGSRKNPEFGSPFDFRRSPLRVTVEVPPRDASPAYELTLFVVHHKSGGGYSYWRDAEAVKVVQLVQQHLSENPGANLAVLGDFNCEAHDPTIQTYRDAGLFNIFDDRDSVDTTTLTHASERAIDMILVSPGLKPEIVMNSRFVLSTAQLRADEDWRTAPKPAGYASDHLPVVIDITPRDK